MTATTAAALPADLVAGLKRLKLAKVRAIAPEVLLTAKTQRWTPEETLRVLVEAEIAARDASNTALRLRTAGFPVTKTLDEFKLTASSVPQATFDYLASLEWVTVRENLCLIGPSGCG
jgi:DNA replication protein DnaC